MGVVKGRSNLIMGNLFTHNSLASLLLNLPVDKANYAVVHVDRAPPHQRDALLLLQGQLQLELLTDVLILEFKLGRELLRFHGSEWRKVYLGRGAFISLSSVSASKLYFEIVFGVENMPVWLNQGENNN
jgi:hypothetical protein